MSKINSDGFKRSGIPELIRWIIGIMVVLLLMMTVYRFLFFYQYRPEGRPFPGSAFVLGLRFDLRVVSVLGLSIWLLCLIPWLDPFKNKRALKGWIILLSLVFFVFLIFYSADFYHYDYLQQRLNASVLNFLEDAAISFDMMWESYPVLLITVFVVAMVLLFGWTVRKIYQNSGRTRFLQKRKYKAIWNIVFFLLLGIFIFGQLGQYPLRWSDAFGFADDFKANVALNPFQSFFSTLKFRNSAYELKKVRSSYPVMTEYLRVDEPDSLTLNFTRSRSFADTFVNKPNVIIVICESFSAYKSSMFGNKLDPTPFFSGLCNGGVFFDRCFVPAFGTARGVWATITGIPDVESPKTASRNPSAVDQHSIINDFKEYEKFYFLGGSTTWANIRGVLTNNLENLSIYEEEHFGSGKVDVWGISDKNLFLESNKIMAAARKPFFSIIQTANNHRPYTIPSEDLKEFNKVTFREDSLRNYGFSGNDELNAFRYMDFSLKKFMEAAAKEAYYDNTIFVFIGDHGLRGEAGSMFPESFTKQGILAQHVPLLFYSPKLLTPARINDVSSQLDILPSVATIAKQSYTNKTMGLDLFDSTRSAPRYAFIADPDLHTIGVVGDRYYYRKNLKSGKEEFVSVKDNLPVASDQETQDLRKRMSVLTDAWFETARYMLLNNKKKN